jgi:glycosyltransferase involved in cell wall biosynthesis
MANTAQPLHVLFVSISFPPKNDPECLQTAKYFSYLRKNSDHRITVVTSAIPTLFMPYDAQLEKYAGGYDQRIDIPIYENKWTNFLLRKFWPGGIDYPDSKFTFHWQMKRVLKSLHTKPDVIYSRSYPLSSTLMAYKLATHFNIPWVMHLSDPWVDSPVKHYSKKQTAYQSKWEQTCFERASAIGLTSQHAVDFYKRKYPSFADKIHLFPNVYDPTDFSNERIDFSTRLKITYTGGLAGERSAKNFLQACQQLVNEKPHLADQFEVIFAGPMDRKSQHVFSENQLTNIRHIGELPYPKALELMKQAHVLLNIDLPIKDPNMAMFFASKLLDYFLAKRTILSLTSKGSASEKALEKVNATVLLLDDMEGIKSFIERAIQAYQAKEEAFFTLDAHTDAFSADMNATKLAQMLATVSGRS